MLNCLLAKLKCCFCELRQTVQATDTVVSFVMCCRSVRDAGGVCIADEAECGLGRLGEAFWGFALQGVCPDIVTLGEAIGNGHPVGAVVTSSEIADKFASAGCGYFNTVSMYTFT